MVLVQMGTGMSEVGTLNFLAVRVTIAIPAYDEIQNLERAVRDARHALEEHAGGDGEVLVVDDGSRDGTGQLADALAAQYADVRVVHHQTNRGFTGAMTTCFREAAGDFIFLAPADGQVSMDELGRFLEQSSKAAIVVGVRDQRAEGLRRTLPSRAFHLFSRTLFGIPYREFSSVFLFRRSLLEGMPFVSKPRSATLLPEILARAHFRGEVIVPVEFHHMRRVAGREKGGQLSVALLTLLDMVRVAMLVRSRERAVPRKSPV